ncbi:MAG: hypothetical protein WBV55_07795 [Candidatus Sulfotelmatobacter sp.]
MIRRLAKIAFAIGSLTIGALGQSTGQATGGVQGVVFTTDADGGALGRVCCEDFAGRSGTP